jgi:hypothetical protein
MQVFKRIAEVLRENETMMPDGLREKVIYYSDKLSGETEDDETPDIFETLQFIDKAFKTGRYKLNEVAFVMEVLGALEMMMLDMRYENEKEDGRADAIENSLATH